MTAALWPQIVFVIVAVGAAVLVVLKAPDGPPIHRRHKRRPRP